MTVLSKFLTQQGLLPSPTLLGTSNNYPSNSNIHIGVSANGPMLYLPFSPVRKNRSRPSGRESPLQDDIEDEEGDQDQSDDEEHQKTANELHHNVSSHTFAIVIKIDKVLDLTPIVKVNYHTDAAVCWMGNERSKKQPFNDRFRVSENMNWDLDLNSPNAFIPIKKIKKTHPTTIDDQLLRFDEDDDDDDDDDSESSNNFSYSNSKSPNAYHDDDDDDYDYDDDAHDNDNSIQYGTESSKHPIKSYIPLEPKNYVFEQGGLKSLDDKTHIETNLFQNYNKQSTLIQPGTYIFLLPIVFPLQTPESINIPNGSIIHKLDIQIQLPPRKDLKIPPSVALSTSPGHHFNNTWNEDDVTSINNTTGSKSSIFKRIGIRRNSNSSNTNKSLATSPPVINKLGGTLGSVSGINFPSTSFDSSRRSSITKIEDRVMNYKYILPVIRLPPSDATSTLNKSIYVNKVWNKSLGYEIVLPKKYTMLTAPDKLLKKQEVYEKKKGSISKSGNHLRKHTVGLQIKLVPLVKGIQLKRVKVNIVEKVTYTSLSDSSGTSSKTPFSLSDSTLNSINLPTSNNNSGSNLTAGPTSSQNQSNNGGYLKNKYSNSRVKERIVPLYEIHTKPSSKKSSLQPLYTQSIRSCKDDNLLTFCYNNNDGSKNGKNGTSGTTGVLGGKFSKFLDHGKEEEEEEDIIISNPIKLNIPITFLANDEKKSIENVWNWLNKSEEYNDNDELEFGMAIIDDLSRRNSITTMRSRVGSIGSMGSGGTNGLSMPMSPPPFSSIGFNQKPESIVNNDLPSIATPHQVIPSIITTNQNGVTSSITSSLPASHQEGTSFLSGMFGSHHGHNNTIQQQQPIGLEDPESRKEIYSFFPDVSFHNLKVRHRLQLGFRISKPDDTIKLADGTPKMHHYEVIVDTPIALLSPLVDGEGDLPSYDSVVGNFDTLSNVSTNNTSVSSGEAILQPSSPLMSNTGTLMNFGNRRLIDPPSYNQTSVSTSSFELSPTSSSPSRKWLGNGSSILSSALRRNGENTTSLNSVLIEAENKSKDFTLDSLISGRNVSKSSLEFQRKLVNEREPPGYDEIISSDGIEKVGLLSDDSGSEGDLEEEEEEEEDDNMSLCTGI